MPRFLVLGTLAVAASACTAPQLSRAPGFDRSAALAAVGAAASQVKRCYRAPRVPTAGKRIVTRLRVRFAADGSLAEAPQVLGQEGVTPENRFYAEAMAEAASLAVFRCSPLHLPPELHRGGWDALDLTFSPRVLV